MKVIVIGGGPAGLMCAIKCAQNGNDVNILDKNEKVGKKLYITGKGRCNVTNYCNNQDFLNNVVTNPKFLYSSLNCFSSMDTISFFENQGIKLKVERGNRVFPESDKSSDIIKGLKKTCENEGVKIILNEDVIDVSKRDETFYVTTKNNKYTSDAVVVCTGGKSYSSTGSTGFGYEIAKKFGHKIIPIKPALCPIKLKDKWVKNIEGLSLKNVQVNVYQNKKLFLSEFGEMIFTSNGVSGPIILTISSYINKINNLELYIDFKPAITNEQLDNRLLREFDKAKNSQINSVLKNLLPKNFVNIFLHCCGIDETQKINSTTATTRKVIVNNLKNFKLNFDSLYDIDYGIITSGGVDIKEINPKTMESKLVKNLFFAGEVLDVDALTGGFNIQIALSTGYCAGKGVLNGHSN